MTSAFSMTFAVLPSITATQEFVVPRSIPMTFPMVLIPFFLRQAGWALTAHQSKTPKRSDARDIATVSLIYGEGAGLQGPRRNLSPRKPRPCKTNDHSARAGLRACP